MRTILLSLGAATALGAAIVWTPLPASLSPHGGDASSSKAMRPPALTMAAPGDIAASHAASLLQFGPDANLAAATPRPGPPILVGLIRSGPRRIAYVMYAGQTARAGLWDKVGPWRVTGIGPHGVTLQGGGRPLALTFYAPRPAPPPPQLAANEDESAGTPPAAAAAPPPMHALEPASAPQPPPSGGKHARYWAGPPGSAPPGYIVLKPGERPPT
jgi:hypothetical protein